MGGRRPLERVRDTGWVRRYNEPARVDTDEQGLPSRIHAWGRVYRVAEPVEPYWEEQKSWWTREGAGLGVEELTVRHHVVRAVGPAGSGVLKLVQEQAGWRVTGVWD